MSDHSDIKTLFYHESTKRTKTKNHFFIFNRIIRSFFRVLRELTGYEISMLEGESWKLEGKDKKGKR